MNRFEKLIGGVGAILIVLSLYVSLYPLAISQKAVPLKLICHLYDPLHWTMDHSNETNTAITKWNRCVLTSKSTAPAAMRLLRHPIPVTPSFSLNLNSMEWVLEQEGK